MVRHNGGQPQITIYVDAHEEQPQEGSGEAAQPQWVATAVTLPVGICDYASIVSAIIGARYTDVEIQATMGNYLQETDIQELIRQLMTTQNLNKLRSAMTTWLNGRDTEIVAEYNAMQEYRNYAKQLAKVIVAEFEPNPEEE
jgi:hypothetical protein